MTLVYFYFHKLIYNQYTLRVLVRVYGSRQEERLLDDRINWYGRVFVLRSFRLELSMFSFWIKNVYSISIFLILLPLNMLLRLIYVLCFLVNVLYWSRKLLLYIFTETPIDLKPLNHQSGFTSWHWAFIYYVTWKRAHLNSFGVLYIFLQRLLVQQTKTPIRYILLKLPFSLLWYIFRLVTSIPRQVILDSYSWSQRFKHLIDIYNWESAFEDGILHVNLMQELGPKSCRRIYFTAKTRWNFNPSPLEKLYLQAKKNTKLNEYEEASNFSKFRHLMKDRVYCKWASITGVTEKPHLLTACNIGVKNNIDTICLNSLSSKFYPPHDTIIKTFPTQNFSYGTQHISKNIIVPKSSLVVLPHFYKEGSFLHIYENHISCDLYLLSICRYSTTILLPTGTTDSKGRTVLKLVNDENLVKSNLITDPEIVKLLLDTVYNSDALDYMSTLSVSDLEEFNVKHVVDNYPEILKMAGSIKFNILSEQLYELE